MSWQQGRVVDPLDTAINALRVLDALARPERTYEPIPTSLEYERFVEAPRRRGVDPVWEAMLAEALGPSHQAGAA